MDSIRWKLRAIMVKKGWTLSTLGDAVGVHRSNLSRFFRDETDLRAGAFIGMLSALGIRLEDSLTAALHGDRDESVGAPAVDLWQLLLQLDGFTVCGVIDRILSGAARQGIIISEKDQKALAELKSNLLIVKKQGGN